MSHSEEHASPGIGTSPVKRNARYRRANAVTATLLAAVVFLVLILVSAFFIVGNGEPAAPADTTVFVDENRTYLYETISEASGDTVVTDEASLSFVGPMPLLTTPTYVPLSVPNSQIATGNLILVNSEHPYTFPDGLKQKVFYGNKSPVYLLSGSALSIDENLFPIFDSMMIDFSNATGCKELLVTSGYRSYADQEKLLNDRIQTMGEDKAHLYVADPGESEHHSGLALDMVIFTGGRQYYFPDHEAGAWIIENAPKYGFFLRYTEAMAAITGCAAEPWHYRYVGLPHAQLIVDMGLCYEQYMEYLWEFSWDGDRLFVKPDGTYYVDDGFHLPNEGYMIYYVPALELGNYTTIPLPPECESYEISGDNVGGFIVTVKFS